MDRRILEAETKYRTLVEQVPAVIYVDPVPDDEPAVYISPQVRDLLGTSQCLLDTPQKMQGICWAEQALLFANLKQKRAFEFASDCYARRGPKR